MERAERVSFAIRGSNFAMKLATCFAGDVFASAFTF
jgi:hypothetical protein